MLTTFDCIPCMVRQALEATRLTIPSEAAHERFVRDVLRHLAEADFSKSPPVVAQTIQRLLREATGVSDPYSEAKKRFNRLALELLPTATARVAGAPDPFAAAVRYAIAGNVIDLGAKSGLSEAEAASAVDRALEEPLEGDLDGLRRVVQDATRILYLADNAGEIVFDRLLVAQLPKGRVTVAVRGRPVLNDATCEDATLAGLHEVATVIDNGSDAPGTVLGDCSEAFRSAFSSADVILAKGQGNFETLNTVPANLFFLFKVKCPVVASHVRLPVGRHVVWRSSSGPGPRASSMP